MQLWAILQYAFALVVAIGCIALAMAEMHIIERAEEQAWKQAQEQVEKIGQA